VRHETGPMFSQKAPPLVVCGACPVKPHCRPDPDYHVVTGAWHSHARASLGNPVVGGECVPHPQIPYVLVSTAVPTRSCIGKLWARLSACAAKGAAMLMKGPPWGPRESGPCQALLGLPLPLVDLMGTASRSPVHPGS